MHATWILVSGWQLWCMNGPRKWGTSAHSQRTRALWHRKPCRQWPTDIKEKNLPANVYFRIRWQTHTQTDRYAQHKTRNRYMYTHKHRQRDTQCEYCWIIVWSRKKRYRILCVKKRERDERNKEQNHRCSNIKTYTVADMGIKTNTTNKTNKKHQLIYARAPVERRTHAHRRTRVRWGTQKYSHLRTRTIRVVIGTTHAHESSQYSLSFICCKTEWRKIVLRQFSKWRVLIYRWFLNQYLKLWHLLRFEHPL